MKTTFKINTEWKNWGGTGGTYVKLKRTYIDDVHVATETIDQWPGVVL